MALENTIAKYEIQILRTGDGATVAIKDLQSVAAAATQANSAFAGSAAPIAAGANSLKNLGTAAAASKVAMAELRSVAMLVGMQTAPQLTSGVMVASSTLSALRLAATASGASLGPLAVILAGVAATVYSATQAWGAYKAKMAEAASESDLINQQLDLRKRLLEQVKQLATAGNITEEQRSSYNSQLMFPTGNISRQASEISRIASELRAAIPPEWMERIKTVTDQMIANTLDGFSKERFEANMAYRERLKQLEDIAQKSKLPDEMYRKSKENAAEEVRLRVQLIDAREKEKQLQEQQRLENEAQIEDQRIVAQQIREFEDSLTIKALQSKESRVDIARSEYEARVEYFEELYDQYAISEDELTNHLNQARIQRLQAEQKFNEKMTLHVMSMQEMQLSAAQSFASGFSQAFVDFASGSKSAEEAFKQFASSFMQEVSRMIIQMMVLKALRSVFFADGGISMSGLAAGGVRFAASGLAGVSSVSSATYFPRFNVVAGEAGREMLTVLARPRKMEIGGMEAVVGNAGRNTLAITNAADLAGRPAGGRIEINVNMEPGLRGEIIDQSVQGAEIRIVQRARQHSSVRNAIKAAAS